MATIATAMVTDTATAMVTETAITAKDKNDVWLTCERQWCFDAALRFVASRYCFSFF